MTFGLKKGVQITIELKLFLFFLLADMANFFLQTVLHRHERSGSGLSSDVLFSVSFFKCYNCTCWNYDSFNYKYIFFFHIT